MTEVIDVKLRKIGNSFGVIIPSSLLDEINAHEGETIHIAISNSNINDRNKKILSIAGIDKEAKRFRRIKEDRF